MAKFLNLPLIHPLMTSAVVTRLHAPEGALLPQGAPLLDVSIDLTGALAHDCPPISHYRLVLREAARLDAWHVAPGDRVQPPGVLARFDEAAGAPDRPVRVMVAGIVPDHGWWTTAS